MTQILPRTAATTGIGGAFRTVQRDRSSKFLHNTENTVGARSGGAFSLSQNEDELGGIGVRLAIEHTFHEAKLVSNPRHLAMTKHTVGQPVAR